MKRAQSSSIDFIIALALFLSVLATSYSLYQTNQQTTALSDQTQALAQAIFSPTPTNYTNETVITPGFVRNHVIDEALFVTFQSLDITTYTRITQNYFVNTTLGFAGTPPTVQAEKYVITRYATYNNSITPIEVVVWRE